METLTAQQQAVVENRGGALLVSAAAGSGKTKVLVERLFRYVMEEGRNLDDFLIITYTRAAAAELRSKIASELAVRVGQHPENLHLRRQMLRVYQADVKTVDAFCTALLRENTHLLPEDDRKRTLTPDFRVLDENEAALLRQRVLRRTLEDFYEDLTPGGELLADTMGAGRDDSRLEALILEVHGKLQSHAYPDRWLGQSRESWFHPAAALDDTPYAEELLRETRRSAAHFAALLRHGAARTEGDPPLMKGYGTKFLMASDAFADLAAAPDWEAARSALDRIVFPRLVTPKGRKDDPLLLSLKLLWDRVKEGVKRLKEPLSTSGEDAMADLRTIAPAMEALLDLTAEFSRRYQAEKLRLNAADFSDQEHLALSLLTAEDGTPTELGRQVASRYVEILVDEYQDTNEVQNTIFRAVSRNGQNLFTVGDVKQSIYRFRLADPTIFLDKYTRFLPWEKAEDGEARKILLSKNFRSRREILDATNDIFSNILSPEMGEMSYGEEEALYFGAEWYPPREDCAVEFHLIGARKRTGENDQAVKRSEAEACFVANRIREMLDSGFPVTDRDGLLRPCRPEDIVILMRSKKTRIPAWYRALWEREIPCSFEDGGGFYQTMEVSTVFALLQIIDNPRQDVPLISVLRSPVFSFSPDRLSEIRSLLPDADFYDAVTAAAEQEDSASGETAVNDCAAFLETLSALRQTALDMGIHRLLWHIYHTLNLLGIFGAMDNGEERRENLIAFTRQAERLENAGCRSLFAFVNRLRRLMESGRTPERTGGTGGGVQLMSIHRSKGLEFPIVFLADLDRDFSRQDFRAPVLVHPELGLGPVFVDLDRRIRYPTLARLAVQARLRRENLAEEQRILYVAMTRAKEKLILVDGVYNAAGYVEKVAATASRPVLPETVAAGKSFGEWLLLALLCRPEAAPLRALSGGELDISGAEERAGSNAADGGDCAVWQVFYHDAEEFQTPPAAPSEAQAADTAPGPDFNPDLLDFSYPFQMETGIPAKVTATQLKGRTLDEEIAEHAAHIPYIRPLSQPRFRWEQGLTPAERGTATHLLLQYLDFSNPDPAAQVEVLTARGLLTEEQAAAVDLRAVRRFLRSPLAEEIRRAETVWREYPFTVLLDAAEYDPASASGDQILLQGVVDCCYATENGLTVVDFKTDTVWDATVLSERVERYRTQIVAYSRALERVLERKVVRRVLYFLVPGAEVEIEPE